MCNYNTSPPPRPKKKVSCLDERIFVIINASAYLLQHFKKELVSQQDFKEQHATAFMITKIRSFKDETFFFFGGGAGGGGGGGSLFVHGTLRYISLSILKTFNARYSHAHA